MKFWLTVLMITVLGGAAGIPMARAGQMEELKSLANVQAVQHATTAQKQVQATEQAVSTKAVTTVTDLDVEAAGVKKEKKQESGSSQDESQSEETV